MNINKKTVLYDSKHSSFLLNIFLIVNYSLKVRFTICKIKNAIFSHHLSDHKKEVLCLNMQFGLVRKSF